MTATTRTTARRALRLAMTVLVVVLVGDGCRRANGVLHVDDAPSLVCPEGADVQRLEYPEERGGGSGERCVRPDGTRHGPSRDWYPDGSIRSLTSWIDGERHGKSTMWHVNGTKAAEVEHSHWLAVGQWTNWDEQGNVVDQKDFGYEGVGQTLPPPVMPPETGPHGEPAATAPGS
jgi:hypothetical protein